MSIQYLEDLCCEEKYLDYDDEQEEIASFNSIVYKDDILQMDLQDSGFTKILQRG